MRKSNEIKGIILAILAATIFGIHPTLVYFLRSEGMQILPTLFVGSIQCFIIYFIILFVTNNLDSLKITKHQFKKLILCSILFYSTLLVLFISYTKIPSGLATVIHFIYPSLVTIISVITKRDKLTRPLLIVIICTFIGVLLISNPSGSNLNVVGLMLAASSAVIFSSYIYMINDDCFKELNNTTFVFYTSFIGGMLLLLAIIVQCTFISTPSEVFGSYTTLVLTGGLSLGISQAIGVLCFAKAIKYVGGPVGGALAAFEPLTAVLIGVVFFSEVMPYSSVIGCLLILLSIIYLSCFKVKN
jgi:drug/metabolite transporter (DMT)-like permease